MVCRLRCSAICAGVMQLDEEEEDDSAGVLEEETEVLDAGAVAAGFAQSCLFANTRTTAFVNSYQRCEQRVSIGHRSVAPHHAAFPLATDHTLE